MNGEASITVSTPPRHLATFIGALGLLSIAYAISGFNPNIWLHAVLFATGLGLTAWCTPAPDRARVTRLFIFAYLLRVAVTLWMHSMSPNGFFALDDQTYDEQGRFLAHGWSSAELQYASDDLGTGHTGYPLLIGWVYAHFGISLISAKLLNAFFGAMAVPLAYLLGIKLTRSSQVAIGAAALIGFYLFDIVWAGYLMKDTMLQSIFTALLLLILYLVHDRKLWTLPLIAIFIFLINSVRFYAVEVLGAAALLATMVGVSAKFSSSRLTRAMAVLSGIAALGVIGYKVLHASIDVNGLFGNVQMAKDVLRTDPEGTVLQMSFTPGFFLTVLRAAFVYLLGPFPWVFKGMDYTRVLFYPGMYLIYAVLPFFFIGCIRWWRQIDWARAFVFFALVLHATVEIVAFQSGERQRIMTDVIFAVLAAYGWQFRHEFRRMIGMTYAVLFLFMCTHIFLGMI